MTLTLTLPNPNPTPKPNANPNPNPNPTQVRAAAAECARDLEEASAGLASCQEALRSAKAFERQLKLKQNELNNGKEAMGIVDTRQWLRYARPYTDYDMQGGTTTPRTKIIDNVAGTAKRALQWLLLITIVSRQ